MTSITLTYLPGNSDSRQKCYSITTWLVKWRSCSHSGHNRHASSQTFRLQTAEDSLPVSLFTGRSDVRCDDMKGRMEEQLIILALLPARQRCFTPLPNMRPSERSHVRPNTSSDTCLCILTWTLTSAKMHAGKVHTADQTSPL